MMIEVESYDRERRTVALRCVKCRWKFRCPVTQLGRVYCWACDSNERAKEEEYETPGWHPL
jgi:hypothetical protein